VHRFTKGLIAWRRRLLDTLEAGDPELHGVRVGEPDLGPDSRSIAMTFRSGDEAIHVICNAWWEPIEFELPHPGTAGAWRRIVDTTLTGPDHLITEPDGGPSVEGHYWVGGRSIVVLLGSNH
jgi:glycogen operon protein